MKRQRNLDSDQKNIAVKLATNYYKAESSISTPTRARIAAPAAMGTKKGKKEVEKEKEERKVVINGDHLDQQGHSQYSSYVNWGDQLPLLNCAVDEQMSWGSTWLPFWDVEYMGEACSEMFSDVVWDYDIWNLRN